MKKLLAKITTIVLILAMLIPFTSIPKVEAATEECSEGETPEYHTNYYFFLHAETPYGWSEMVATGSKENEENKPVTNYLTQFLYNFPSDGSKLVIEDEGFVPIVSGNYSQDFDASNATDQWTVGQFYKELQLQDMTSTYSTNGMKQYAYSNNSTGNSNNDRIVTYLFHGDWAEMSSSNSWDEGLKLSELNDLSVSAESLFTSSSNIQDLIDSSILIGTNRADLESRVTLGFPHLSGNKYTLDSGAITKAIKSFNNTKGDDGDNIVYMADKINNPVISVYLRREYKISDIFKDNVQIESSDGGNITGNYSSQGSKSLTLPTKENEYIQYDSTPISKAKTIHLEDGVSKNDYWFLAPMLYQISYKVCKTGNNATTGDTVTVRYDGNADNVSNVPNQWTGAYGSSYTISSQEPTRDGYAFQSWNSSASCDGKSYDPGVTINSVTNNMTLYACWGATGNTNNSGTGVITYAGIFSGIIALAGGAYYIVRKKNLFKKF